jgi:hypothetical protein
MDISSLPPYRGLANSEPSQRERLIDKDQFRAEQGEYLLIGFLIGLLLLGILAYLLFWLLSAGPFPFYPQLA